MQCPWQMGGSPPPPPPSLWVQGGSLLTPSLSLWPCCDLWCLLLVKGWGWGERSQPQPERPCPRKFSGEGRSPGRRAGFSISSSRLDGLMLSILPDPHLSGKHRHYSQSLSSIRKSMVKWASAWVQILDLIILAFGPWASYITLWTSLSKSELNNRLFLTRCHENRVKHAQQVPRRVSYSQTCPPDVKRTSLRAGISAAFSPPRPTTLHLLQHLTRLPLPCFVGRLFPSSLPPHPRPAFPLEWTNPKLSANSLLCPFQARISKAFSPGESCQQLPSPHLAVFPPLCRGPSLFH